MPHLVLETTADLPENAHVPDILEALTLALSELEDVSSASISACHMLRSVWCMGAGAPPGFARLTVSVLSGRPLAWRKAVSSAMLRVLREHLSESLPANEVYVAVEVREMERESYMR